MTLLEKIKNYNWFDSPNKLRTILEELYNSIGGGSGGGTQDLQSVLDNGNTATTYLNIGNATKFSTVTNQSYILYDIPNRLVFGFGETNPNTLGFGILNLDNNFNITVGVDKTELTEGINIHYKLNSNKPNGNYTLATLDDIKKIDLTGRVYANNASAIIGGLTVNDVYRTSTGELRIVV